MGNVGHVTLHVEVNGQGVVEEVYDSNHAYGHEEKPREPQGLK